MVLPLIAAGVMAAGSAVAANQNKPETKQKSTLSKQQKGVSKILTNQAMSQLGQWVKTPKGLVFEWNPNYQARPDVARVAPLNNMQKAGTQMGWDATQNASKNMAGATNRANAITGYRPGNLGSTLAKLSRPQQTSSPYQYNPMALTGKVPQIPIQKSAPQYITNTNQQVGQIVNPYTAQETKAFKGPQTSQSLGSAINMPNMIWDYANGPVPQVGYLEPRDSGSGWPSWLSNSLEWSTGVKPSDKVTFGGSWAKGGPMPGPQGEQPMNLVGEQGPEMHIGADGTQNMIGEEGPELLAPNQPGTVIPNHQLPPQMQQGQGPQGNTGQEIPLPGGDGGQGGMQGILNMIANALLQPAMTVSGQGRAMGGSTNWNYDQTGTGYNVPTWSSNGTGTDEWANISSFENWVKPFESKSADANPMGQNIYNQYAKDTAGKSAMPTYQNFNDWAGQQKWEQQRPDYGASQFNYDQTKNMWSTPGQAGQYTPGSTWNAQTGQYDQGSNGWQYNYATSQWEMPASSNQYQQSQVPGWSFNTQANMWTPQGWQAPVTPPETPPGDTPTTPGTPPSTETGYTDPFGKFNDDFAVDPSLYTTTGLQTFAQQNPEQYAALMSVINQTTPSYQYDPNQVSQAWQQGVYKPAMDTFWEQTAPQLQRYGNQTGNLYGGQVGRNVEQAARAREEDLQGTLANMQLSSQQLGAQSADTLRSQRLSGLGTYGQLAQLPSQIGLTQAQSSQILNDIDSSQKLLGISAKQAFANLDLTKANTEQVYQNMSKYNQNLSDAEVVDNMIKLAQYEGILNTNYGQEISHITQQLQNALIAQGIGNLENQTVQQLLNLSWTDFENQLKAMGQDPIDAINQLRQSLGMSQIENITTVPNNQVDMSAIGMILANMGSK